MSWEVINQILGLAVVDHEFSQNLLKDPITAIRSKGFFLTGNEERVLGNNSAKNLQELSKYLLKELQPDQNA